MRLTNKKRKERAEKNREAVEKIYARAMPERQEYPPRLRDSGESVSAKPPFNKSQETARRRRQMSGSPSQACRMKVTRRNPVRRTPVSSH
jgi:hypothetical protein